MLGAVSKLTPVRDRNMTRRGGSRGMDEFAEISLGPGPWQPPGEGDGARVGYLVLDGMLLRRVLVGEGRSVELLGRDDLLLPGRDEAVSFARVEWRVVDAARVAVLDLRPGSVVSRRPGIAEALVRRAIDRSRSLAMQAAIMSIVGIEDRLHALFWALAERWGRPLPEGAEIDLKVPQAVLAEMVGARRPTVSQALGALCETEVLETPAPGRWVLRGEPPEYPAAGSPAGRTSIRK